MQGKAGGVIQAGCFVELAGLLTAMYLVAARARIYWGTDVFSG